MKKIKKLFDKNIAFRYISSFIIMIFLFSLLLIIEKTIPNQRVQYNILKSEPYYQTYYKKLYSNIEIIKNRHTMVDIPGDLYHLSNLYFEDNKHPIKDFIEMNKDSQLATKIQLGESFRDMKIDSDYSRYWNGHLVILKPLLTFFTIDIIYIIYLIVLSITFLYLLLCLLKHSKILTIIITLSSICINILFVSKCDNFTHVFMITMISSIIIIKLYERKQTKYVDLVFFIGGMLTAYLDMLSCGTLPLTLPLFIYIYLHMINHKKIKFKLILKYILLWFFGLLFTYAAKWIILLIHYNGGLKEHIIEPMKVRIGSGDKGRIEMFIDSITQVPHFIFPYDLYLIKNIIILIGIASFIYLLFDKKERNYYLYLLLICIIPFIRYLFLAEHSNYHNYFTYRCFLPVIMLILLSITNTFIKLFNKKKRHT